MAIETVQVSLGGGESLTLENVEFEHSQPPGDIVRDMQGNPTEVLKMGEVRIKINGFDGWEEAHGFLVNDKFYEVRTLYTSPRSEGEWLIYPIAPR